MKRPDEFHRRHALAQRRFMAQRGREAEADAAAAQGCPPPGPESEDQARRAKSELMRLRGQQRALRRRAALWSPFSARRCLGA
eukprot:8946367-Pyramimonas_sp.AAC.1